MNSCNDFSNNNNNNNNNKKTHTKNRLTLAILLLQITSS
jgi:hypothetical protein